MAKTIVTEMPGSSSRQSLQELSANRKFTVEFSGYPIYLLKKFTPVHAEVAKGIPKMGSKYPASRSRFVQEIIAKRIKADYYEVEVFYRDLGFVTSTNPLREKPKIKFGSVNNVVEVDRDIKDKPVVNSAGEGFDPQMTKDVADMVLSIERNEKSFPLKLSKLFNNSINADTFLGARPGNCLLKPITGEPMGEGRRAYWQIEYEIHFRWDGWKQRKLDEGFRQLVSGKLEQIKDSKEQLVSEPYPLDGKGAKLSDAKIKSQAYYFLEFDAYEKRSFSQLGLSDGLNNFKIT